MLETFTTGQLGLLGSSSGDKQSSHYDHYGQNVAGPVPALQK